MTAETLTVWQALSGRSQDMLVARPAVSAVIALIYGVYKFFKLGTALEHYLYTYVPVAGAVLSVASMMVYAAVCSGNKRSMLAAAGALSGLIPYVFSLYLMGFLGCYRVWLSVNPFSIWGLLIGLVWIVLGYRLLRKFWIITELASLPIDQGNVVETLTSKLGMSLRELEPLFADEKMRGRLSK